MIETQDRVLVPRKYVRAKVFKLCGYLTCLTCSLDVMFAAWALFSVRHPQYYFDGGLLMHLGVASAVASSVSLVVHLLLLDLKEDFLVSEKVKGQLTLLKVLRRLCYADRLLVLPVAAAFCVSLAASFVTRGSIIEQYTRHKNDYFFQGDSHAVIDDVHLEYGCCGATGPYEWVFDHEQFPPSCCNSTDPRCFYLYESADSNAIYRGRHCATEVLLERRAAHACLDVANFWHLVLLAVHWHLSVKYFNGVRRDLQEEDPAEVSSPEEEEDDDHDDTG